MLAAVDERHYDACLRWEVHMQGSTSLIIRGAISLLVGIAAIVWPGITLLALVVLFAVYALLDGILNLMLGFTRTPFHDRSWTQVLLGVVGLAAAIIAVMLPGMTLLWLVLFIAAWAVVRGIVDIVAAIQLRKVIHGEWLLALAGVLSIIFGIVVFMFPAAGAITIAWLLGVYAAAWGIVLIGVGIRLRRPIAL
jgi:uncharacterized membrane protein HdeD (DUF308 family)